MVKENRNTRYRTLRLLEYLQGNNRIGICVDKSGDPIGSPLLLVGTCVLVDVELLGVQAWVALDEDRLA